MSSGEAVIPFEVLGASVRLRLASALYSDFALQKTAYRLAAKCSALFEVTDGFFVVSLIAPGELSEDSARQLVVEFLRYLNDEVLREKIGEQTKGIRELLLAQAFTRTGLVAVE